MLQYQSLRIGIINCNSVFAVHAHPFFRGNPQSFSLGCRYFCAAAICCFFNSQRADVDQPGCDLIMGEFFVEFRIYQFIELFRDLTDRNRLV